MAWMHSQQTADERFLGKTPTEFPGVLERVCIIWKASSETVYRCTVKYCSLKHMCAHRREAYSVRLRCYKKKNPNISLLKFHW